MRTKTNSTGSKSRDIQIIGGWNQATLLYSYDTVVGYRAEIDGKVKTVLAQNCWSITTAKHLSDYRDEFGLEKGDCFNYGAFKKRAKIDGVDVL